MEYTDYVWPIILLTIGLYLIYSLFGSSAKYTFPPGPTGWPIVGNVLDVDAVNYHLSFDRIAKHYRDMFSLSIFGRKLLVINKPELIRKAMSSDEFGEIFANRPESFVKRYTIYGRGIVFSDNSDAFRKRRKLLFKMINMYGDGVQQMESSVNEELNNVITALEEATSPPVLEDIIYPSLVNVISIMVLGKRFDYEADEIQIITQLMENANQMGNPGVNLIMNRFPFVRHVSFGLGRYYCEFQRLLGEFYKYYFNEPKATFQPGVSRGLLDVLFQIRHEAEQQKEPCWIDEEDIKAIVFDLLSAGILTTRSSLLFFFLAILHQPEVAKRVQEEVDGVVGSGRLPSLKDRADMPYTVACILETLRLSTVVTVALPHCTTKDVTFEGYHLPANTMVFANLWHLLHNEVLWEKPWDFRPQRFLDEAGNILPAESPNRRNMIAFGVGRRSCVGENFAKARMFLFITTLLQRFNFTPPNTGELPPLDPRKFRGATVPAPDRFKITVDPR